MGFWHKAYCVWATLAIGLSVAIGGLKPENTTRLLVIGFLLGQIAFRDRLASSFPRLDPKKRFIVLGTVLAMGVEGFHMISAPVFPSLRVTATMSWSDGLYKYYLDLLFTVPAYLAIFSVIWWFINRFQYSLWNFAIVMGLAQALGDGGIFFFLGAPGMLFFLPYPMTNYHAINVIPFLAVRKDLPGERTAGAASFLAIPGVIGTYLVCGAIIKLLGRACGLEPG